MQLDDNVISLIRMLHTGCRSTVSICGRRFMDIEINAGIKRGCPLSGTIFALLMDPVVRMLHATAPNLRGELAISAYADDIAAVMSDFLADILSVLHVFVLLTKRLRSN